MSDTASVHEQFTQTTASIFRKVDARIADLVTYLAPFTMPRSRKNYERGFGSSMAGWDGQIPLRGL